MGDLQERNTRGTGDIEEAKVRLKWVKEKVNSADSMKG